MMGRKRIYLIVICTVLVLMSTIFLINGCGADKVEIVKVGQIPDEEYDPAEWGKVYPLEYESWEKTKEPRPVGKSKYKRGWDEDGIIYDKMSEFPYLALLFNGWGFGVEYNEPRGHYYMVMDQLEVDPSRLGAGGACLTCKTPYMNKLVKENGPGFFKMPYMEAWKKIPEKHRKLGASCIDCHDNRTMDLSVKRWTMDVALKKLGKEELTRQEKRIIVCAQCHVTYNVTKNDKMASQDIVFPWTGSKWGDISIENIIKVLKANKDRKEWTQKVTGFKLAFIRHPEFEFFSRQSVHFKAGLACADCHMPYKREGSLKISDHNVMSPLKNDLRACVKCHPQSEDRLKKQVIAIQDRTASLLNRAGYAVSTAAKLFEMANESKEKGRAVDTAVYSKAADFYLEAFYRLIFIGAENSTGFHNPTEAGRILGDAIAFASKAEGLLRQGLSKAGFSVPEVINLELSKYVNNRGKKKLRFKPEQELKDPFGIEDLLIPRNFLGL